MEADKEQRNSEVEQDVSPGQLGICNVPSAAVGCGHKMNCKAFICNTLFFKITVKGKFSPTGNCQYCAAVSQRVRLCETIAPPLQTLLIVFVLS